MRGMLKAYGVSDRAVHLVDSFEGLPHASTAEDHDMWAAMDYLKVPLVRPESPSDVALGIELTPCTRHALALLACSASAGTLVRPAACPEEVHTMGCASASFAGFWRPAFPRIPCWQQSRGEKSFVGLQPFMRG